ncbi:DNA-binding transcriptional activator GcvA [compost metagenome]
MAQHDKIVFTYANGLVPWRYQMGGEARDISAQGALRLSNTEAIRDATLAGLGVAQLGEFLVGDDIRHGRLIPLLPDYVREETPICAVYPTRRHVSPKVRRFVEMLRADWANGAPWI